MTQSSPRPWGCFFHNAKILLLPTVFPTPVGVFPKAIAAMIAGAGLPHARGGVSTVYECHRFATVSSPRALFHLRVGECFHAAK